MQQFQSLPDPAHSSNAVSHVPRNLYTCKQALVHHDAMNCLNKTCSHGCHHLPHNHINYCQPKVYNCTLLTPPDPPSTSSLATKPIELRGFLGSLARLQPILMFATERKITDTNCKYSSSQRTKQQALVPL